MTPDEWAIEAKKRRDAMRPKQPKKRTGKTPEAKVSEQIDKYLERLDFYVLRTSAGMATIDDRKMQIGRAWQRTPHRRAYRKLRYWRHPELERERTRQRHQRNKLAAWRRVMGKEAA